MLINEINRFSFNESRKINSYIDYEEYTKSRRRFQRTWIEACNPLSNFYFSENNGIFDPGIGSIHKVKIEIKDANKITNPRVGNQEICNQGIGGRVVESHPLSMAANAYQHRGLC